MAAAATRQFMTFVSAFKKVVEQTWNDQLLIHFPDQNNPTVAMNKADFDAFLDPVLKNSKLPYLKCRLTIEPVSKGPFMKVYCVKLRPGQPTYRAFTAPWQGIALSADGVVPITPNHSPTEIYTQIAAAHEVGHLIGLPHPNPSDPLCLGPPGDTICYGSTPLQRSDIMGWGSVVNPSDATPWLNAIEMHTGHAKDKGWVAKHA